MKQDFAECDDREAYGDQSVFARFHQLNGTIVSIGLPWNSTFSIHHYVEYRVGCDYRRVKSFSGVYVGYDREARLKTYSMCVRRDSRVVTDIAPGMDELFERGIIKATRVGEAEVHFAAASDFFENMAEVVRNRPEKLHRTESPTF
jgi:aminoglycoside 3-N-acetyltransferase